MTTLKDIHQFKIAKRTLSMTDEMVNVMGGMTKVEARKILNTPDSPPDKYWTSPVPEKCDLCLCLLVNEEIFVDGKTRDGSWAIMCKSCWDTRGIGIGTGMGQVYELPSGKKIGG